MIKSLEIKNFQSHKATSIKLDPGVNVIVGESDSGKTSILRALKWLFRNRPLGDDMLSHWGGEMSVSITTDTNTISRTKSVYRLDDNEFKAFRADVPDEIIKALNIGEINLQEQLDMPFLLTGMSPGEVAAHFNRVARLDKIDSSLRNTNGWVRALEQDIKYKTDELENDQIQLKQYDYVDKLEAEVEVLEHMETQRNKLSSDKSKVFNLVNDYKILERRAEEENKILQHKDLVETVLLQIENHDALITTRDDLETTLEEYYEIIEEEERLEEHLLAAEPSVNELYVQLAHRTEAETQRTRLIAKVDHINATTREINNTQAELEQLEKRFHRLFPDVCPLCNGTGGKPKIK